VTPLYPQKLALTSPTGGGRSVGIVRSRTKATEFRSFLFVSDLNCFLKPQLILFIYFEFSALCFVFLSLAIM